MLGGDWKGWEVNERDGRLMEGLGGEWKGWDVNEKNGR